MAGIRRKSGPPANQNAFKHGLVGITRRRASGALNSDEKTIRVNILAGLIVDPRVIGADETASDF
jgi:hypothetical protein